MTAHARDPRTGCNCAVRIDGRRIRWGFNYPDYQRDEPVDGWQYEDDLPRLARQLGWEATVDTRWCALDLLRRYINAGADEPWAAALTAAQREIEELTLP